MRRSRLGLRILAGCAVLFVVATVLAGYAAVSLFRGFQSGAYTCLPSAFPSYPGATYAGQTFDLNGTYPGNTCQVTFQSRDDVATVIEFYQARLNDGGWVRSIAGPAGQVNFQQAGSGRPFGTLSVAAGDPQTQIAVEVFSSTCLPIGFPTYPGARFGGQSEDQTAGCRIKYESDQSVSRVAAFYADRLNTGNWHVIFQTRDAIGFRLANGKRTDAYGTVNLGASDGRTEITIDSRP